MQIDLVRELTTDRDNFAIRWVLPHAYTPSRSTHERSPHSADCARVQSEFSLVYTRRSNRIDVISGLRPAECYTHNIQWGIAPTCRHYNDKRTNFTKFLAQVINWLAADFANKDEYINVNSWIKLSWVTISFPGRSRYRYVCI